VQAVQTFAESWLRLQGDKDKAPVKWSEVAQAAP
jgi:hypothetical protein